MDISLLMDNWDFARSLEKDKHETGLLPEVNLPLQERWTWRIQDWATSNYDDGRYRFRGHGHSLALHPVSGVGGSSGDTTRCQFQ